MYVCVMYIYIHTLEFDLSLYRDRSWRNPQVRLQSRIVDTIRRFRHSVVLHSEVIKVSRVVKVVHFSKFVKDLHSEVDPANKVVKVVKLRGQA